MKACCWLVVYHGQTGRFIIHVWANGKQNSAPVNFVPESRLPSVLIHDQFHLPKNGRESLKLVSKNWLWRNGTRISVRKNRTTFRMYRCARKFCDGKTQNVVFRLLSNRKPFVKGNERYLLRAVCSNKVQKHHQQTSNYILNKPLPWFNKG